MAITKAPTVTAGISINPNSLTRSISKTYDQLGSTINTIADVFVFGKFTLTALVIKGAVIIKIINNTNITSTNGVILIVELNPVLRLRPDRLFKGLI